MSYYHLSVLYCDWRAPNVAPDFVSPNESVFSFNCIMPAAIALRFSFFNSLDANKTIIKTMLMCCSSFNLPFIYTSLSSAHPPALFAFVRSPQTSLNIWILFIRRWKQRIFSGSLFSICSEDIVTHVETHVHLLQTLNPGQIHCEKQSMRKVKQHSEEWR